MVLDEDGGVEYEGKRRRGTSVRPSVPVRQAAPGMTGQGDTVRAAPLFSATQETPC
jgi:hypothetical protein